MPIPNIPHTNIRGKTPNPFRQYTPALIRKPIISPKVDKETHDHAMSRIKSMIPFVNRPADKKG